jgi:hypothetical protein
MNNIIYNSATKSLASAVVLFYLLISFISCNKEVTVTPPDSPPPNGYIFINSNPMGFYIYLDNRERRRATPDSLTWLTTGTYQVTLKKDLYKDTSITVDIVEGKKQSVFVDFTQNPSMKGTINCTSSPSKAAIYINDSSTGLNTPSTLSLMPGNYYIRYHFENHSDDSVLTTVSSGKTSTANLILIDSTLWQVYTILNSGIPSNNLSCVSIDKNNIIWVGSFDKGYFSFDGKALQSYYNSFSSVIDCINTDANNIKYVGTERGLVVVNIDNSTHEYGFMSSGFPDFHINAVAFDNNGVCYVATNASITIFPSWADYSPFMGDEQVNLPITSLAIDAGNNIWAAMNNNGVAHGFSKKSWKFYNSASPGIFSNNITALAASSTGEVWAGFDNGAVFGNGLSYFDGTNWNKVYPIPASSRTNTIFIDKNNIKWVGTTQGIVKFSSPSNATIFNYDNTGLNITNVTGVSQDSHGVIWIATSAGLFKYKGNH